MHPIIALWSHPRSMSTATERIMRERGDLDCAHEPFMYDYYVHRKAAHMPHFDVRPDHPVRYEDIRDMLLGRAEAGPVFFKDMSYYVLPRILEDEAFSRRLTNTFLIRDPRAALVSYHRLDPAFSSEEAGLAAQWDHFGGLRRLTGKTPVVIRAEDIRNDPEGMIGAYWEAVGLSFEPGAFEWAGQTPEDWEQVGAWHGAVSRSRAIRPMAPDHAEKARIAFDELAAEYPRLSEILAQHLPCYEKLSAQALPAPKGL